MNLSKIIKSNIKLQINDRVELNTNLLEKCKIMFVIKI